MELTKLAIQKIPISQILEKDLLHYPFPKTTVTSLEERLTLENLNQEGLLVEDMDPYILQRIFIGRYPKLVWVYIISLPEVNKRLNLYPDQVLGMIPDYPPNSKEGQEFLKDITSRLNTTDVTIQKLLDQSIAKLYLDFLTVMANPNLHYVFAKIRFTWEKQNNVYIGYLHNRRSFHSLINNNLPPWLSIKVNTIDEMLNLIVTTMIYDDSLELLPKPISSLSFSPIQIQAIQKLSQGQDDYINAIWDQLKIYPIVIHNHLQFAPSHDWSYPIILQVIGNYLYLRSVDLSIQSNPYFDMTHGKLFLSSLYYNQDEWRLLK